MAHWNRFRLLFGIWILAYPILGLAGEAKWIEVRSPNFTVVSDASKKTARRVAKRLEQFRGVFRSAFPDFRIDLPSPLTVFAARDEQSLKALIPREMGRKGMAAPAGIFMSGPERKFVVFRANIPGDQGYHVIYHEYTHMLMDLNFQSLPLWLSEGFAELFGYATISDKSSRLGQPSPDLLDVLKNSSLTPLATLISVTHDSPYYRDRDKIQLFYAQSWALAHYLMLGEKQRHLPQLNQFLRLIGNGMPDQEAMERAFGSPAELQRNLEDYIRLFSFYNISIQTELDIQEDRYAVRELSRAESLASRGEVLIYADRTDEARAMLDQALELDPRNANANQAMGALFFRLNEYEKAEAYFTAAADLDSESYLAQYFAAQMAYEQDRDYEASEGYLRKAIVLNPRFAPAYRMLSQILMMRRENSTLPEALDLAVKAATLEPADLSHRIHVGRILIAMGRYDEAQDLAKGILAISREEPARGQAETLLLMIKQRQETRIQANRETGALNEDGGKTEAQRRARRKPEEERQSEKEARAREIDSFAPKIKTGPAKKVRGLVGSVICGFPATMDVTLNSNGEQIRLRAENYYQVQYWAVGSPGKTGFEPCEELTGKNVEIEFISVMDQKFSGLIKTVAIQ